MAYANDDLSEVIVQRGEPTLVPPMEDAKKGLYFLSNIDLTLQMKACFVYCYKPRKRGNGEAVEVIKNALSKILVLYYPLAGRLTSDSEGRPVVNCTGEGAYFVEAEANCTIEEMGDDTILMDKMVYNSPQARNMLEVPPLAAQVTKFKCGGFILGICINHLLFDGYSSVGFINSWGDVARGINIRVPPFMDRSILKARKLPKVEFPHHEFLEVADISNIADLYCEEMLYKSFGFPQNKLQKLKLEAMEDGVILKCSTFEVLSAFLWKARTRALNLQHDQKTKLLLAVDGRSRFNPPLPDNYFGNVVYFANCISNAGELATKPLPYAVGLVQGALKAVTDGYMRSGIDYLEANRNKGPSQVSTFTITTWTKLRFKTTDFGWGEPFLTGRASLPRKEIGVFLPHPKNIKAIKVILGLPASRMKIFEKLIHISEKNPPFVTSRI